MVDSGLKLSEDIHVHHDELKVAGCKTESLVGLRFIFEFLFTIVQSVNKFNQTGQRCVFV